MSAPATGTSFKMTVDQDGLYRLTYSDLQAAGVPVDVINPRTFRMWEQGQEIAIYVQGEGDGSFDPGDAIFFYGRMAHTPYQDANVYWLTYGGTHGLRMSTRDVTPGSAPLVSDYPRRVHREKDVNYWRNVPMTPNADHWYWDEYNAFVCTNPWFCAATRTRSYTVTLQAISPLPHTAVLRPRMHGVSEDPATNPDHHLIFYVNGTPIGDAMWDGVAPFTGELTFSQSLLITGTNVISFYVPLDTVSSEYGLTNWLEIDYYALYRAENDHIAFSIAETGDRRVEIDGFTDPTIFLLDVTDPQHPSRLVNATVTPSGGAYTLAFQDAVATPDNAYFAAAAPAFLTPTTIALDTPSDLKNTANQADWIVITHAAFRTQAEQLAAHRAAFSGLTTMVVDVQDIYDEFSGGLLDPEAIRQFLAYAHDHWRRPAPRYVVLFGDGHYDFKGNKPFAFGQFIPPYLDMVDCFLGETAADNRYVAGPRTSSNPDALECQKHAMPFMALGRLPANDAQEANTIVRRIICYEDPSDPLCTNLPEKPGSELRAIFVADNNDNAGAFTCHSDEVAGQQRCPDQDFGFKPVTPRAVAQTAHAAAPRRHLQPLAVVGAQVTDRTGFIGDYIWLDANGNAWPDASESGIDGVIVNLWEDVDGNGALSPADRLVATVQSGDNPHTTTTEHGWYGFDGLEKSNYLVEIDASNFDPGGALEGLTLSAGQNPWPVHMDGVIPDEYSREKIYLRDESAPGVIPYSTGTSARNALLNAINAGAAFVTYNGHANTTEWAGEKIMTVSAISALSTTVALPVFLPMTCLEGTFHEPDSNGLSESLVRAVDSNGNPIGAVASWAPTGLGVATGHTYLYTGFFEAVFHKGILTIGDAVLYAKRKLYESDSLFKDLIETYTLFGDPAMRLRVPQPDLQVSKVVAPPGVVQAGDILTYTMTIVNAGTATAFDVTITDTLPSSLIPRSWSLDGLPYTLVPGTTYAWHITEMAPGQVVTITVEAQVDPNAPQGTPVVNTVEARSGSADGNPADNTATAVSDVGSTYSIQGWVFSDSNGNHTFDAGESGLGSVHLTLSDASGPLATTTTDASGVYTFTGLLPGTYTVQVNTPSGLVPTTPTSQSVTISDASVLGVNFGFISPTAVTVADVQVARTRLGVRVQWTVLDEEGVVGYHLYRGHTSTTGHRVTAQAIPAQGVSRATYVAEDRPPAGGNWYYWVEAVGPAGPVTRVGPFLITDVVAGYRTFVPLVAPSD